MAKVQVNLSAPERDALRKAPAAVQALSDQIDKATPEQIRAAVDAMTLPDAKQAIYVLVMRSLDHERRIRALERRT